MKILLTGASGFLGLQISRRLKESHDVITVGRPSGSQVICDLSLPTPKLPKVDMVVHAAGKAHSLPKTAEEDAEFFRVNVQGTSNLLKGLEHAPPKTFVFISSVAVYGVEWGEGVSENCPLNGATPYAKSKIEAEKLVRNWCKAHACTAVILRLPLVTGENPPGNLKAMATAIKSRIYVRIGDGEARKSIVSATAIAELIPGLVNLEGTYNLTDGVHPTIHEIEKNIAQQFGRKIVSWQKWPLALIAKVGDVLGFIPLNTLRLKKLTSTLTFNDDLARKQLNWNPKPALQDLEFTNG